MNKYVLGVEVLGTSVKIATISVGKKNNTLVSIDKLALPLGDAAQDFLNEWISDKFKSDDDVEAALSISESSVFLESVRLPSISKKSEVEEALYWELSSTTSVPISELTYDWKLSQNEAGKPIARVALTKSLFTENWVNLFEKAGVKVKLVEPSSISFTRAAKSNFSKITLTLVVEEKGTDLVILENAIPIFSTSLSVSIGAVEGDRRKLKKEVSEEIAENANKIVSYWEEKEGNKVEQAVITGAIANKYFGLATEINKFLDFPVTVAKSKNIDNLDYGKFKGIDIEQNMVSVGAALYFVDSSHSLSLNLLPKDRKKVLEDAVYLSQLSNDLSSITKVNLVALTAMVVVIVSLFFVGNTIKRLNAQTRQDIANHPGVELQQKVVADNKSLLQINKYLDTYIDPSVRVSEITSLIPNGITFEELEMTKVKGENWIISGVGSKESVVAFYQKLSSDSSAKKVIMPYSNFDNNNENTFEIELIW